MRGGNPSVRRGKMPDETAGSAVPGEPEREEVRGVQAN